ncbi:hypothetical protein KP509_27G006800 [Ceratopteris richardii]|uniref:Pentatricopeptide repeat-containing protein n=1 Tax=Ceratopteris richardii TaxID=49495 RepID=A0A8T2RF57_CERRI|nr:hypothetical protein KP509_27G006800 [Ceratopteris richardii]
MYAKCGFLLKAQEFFDTLKVLNVVTWNALIGGYVLHGHGSTALRTLDRMEGQGFAPNLITFTFSFKACACIRALEQGSELHSNMLERGLPLDHIVITALVDMYAKCGALVKAQEAFDACFTHDVATWNALIVGYVQNECCEEALLCFEKKQTGGISPNAITLACVLRACSLVKAVEKGKEIHAEVVQNGLLKADPFIGSAVVDMYAKCGALSKAKEVLKVLPERDVVVWNSLIVGYVLHDYNEEALFCFDQMQAEGVSPNIVTYACSLNACGNIGALEKGSEIHVDASRKALLELALSIGSALVDMYAKCGALVKAQEAFDACFTHDVDTWNALIAGYVQNECCEEALLCFEKKQTGGISPNAITLACVLRACSLVKAVEKGKEIHTEVVQNGLLKADPFIRSAVVDMYAKCGALSKAKEVLKVLPERDVVVWNSLIVGYVLHDYNEEALFCFDQMQAEGVSPNIVTYACSVNACGNIGALEKGSEIHADASRKALLELDLSIGSALVDMYAKCGELSKSSRRF